MTSTSFTLGLKPASTWFHRWIYYLAAGFMAAAVLLRSILIFGRSPQFHIVLILFFAWLLVFGGSDLLSRRFPWASALLIGLELLATLSLILATSSIHSDFFAFLFAVTGIQVMQQYNARAAAFVIGAAAMLTFFSLLQPVGLLNALALSMVYTALSVFIVSYIAANRRTWIIQEQQQSLTGELDEANRKLDGYARQVQKVTRSRERQRLARELHDSVTQTIFSMTLTTQSARLLLNRDRQQVAAQLDRLDQLSESALSEMQVLIAHLAPETRGGDFLDGLRKHVAERQRLDNLSVSLEVEGNQPLIPAEEASLFRIAQEALNNIVKHAHTPTAVLRLHLAEPFWMEVEDRGTGFDPQQVESVGRMGLGGMGERAAEIGWIFNLESAPGQGTRIRIQKGAIGK